MSTLKKRFHVSLPSSLEEILIALAKKDGVPTATMAAELLKESLESREDEVFQYLIDARKKSPDWTDWNEAKSSL